jgi:hypothetical protein
VLPTSHKGAATELQAAVWLLLNGYEVFRNVSSTGPVDLIAINLERGELLLLDAKTRPSAPLKSHQQAAGVQTITPAPGGGFIINPTPPPPENIPFERHLHRRLRRLMREQQAPKPEPKRAACRRRR